MREKHFTVDKLSVDIYTGRKEMGAVVAGEVAQKIHELQKNRPEINIIFAAAPSQDDILQSLREEEGIEWHKINAFHMDEYIGLFPGSKQSFRYYLEMHLFNLVAFKAVYFIDSQPADVQQECQRYSALLTKYPPDIVCLGIGENGHIAFNDPPVADFNDPEKVKVVQLDSECRQQQVNDLCFPDLDQVPTHAITLTIPALLAGKHLFVTVPDARKAKAVYKTINDPVSTECPATILRMHETAKLFLDNDSARLL